MPQEIEPITEPIDDEKKNSGQASSGDDPRESQIRELRENMSKMEGRFEHLTQNYHRERQQNQGWNQWYQDQQRRQQQGEEPSWEPPDVGSRILDDPTEVNRGLKETYGAARSYADQVINPLQQELRQGGTRLNRVEQATIAMSLERARKLYEDRGFDDWEDLGPEVFEEIRTNYPDAAAALMQPRLIMDALILARDRKGLPLAVSKAPKPGPDVPINGSGDGSRRSTSDYNLDKLDDGILAQFGLKKDELTDEQIAEFRRAGGNL